MARSPQEVFQAHVEALGKADLALLLEDYRDDAILMTVNGPIIRAGGNRRLLQGGS